MLAPTHLSTVLLQQLSLTVSCLPELLVQECKCVHWGWAPYHLLVSALCPFVVFCGGLHLL